MSHELVFHDVMDAQGALVSVARLLLAQAGGVAWHNYGELRENPTLADVHEVLDTSTDVECFPLTYPDGTVSRVSQGVRWEGRELGTVGPDWSPLQNKDFVDSFAPWIEGGFATVETAGLLRNGALAFMTLKPKIEALQIRPEVDGDSLSMFVLGVNGHDGKVGMRAGSTSIRGVCANTVTAGLREMDAIERRGQANSFRATHRGSATVVKAKMGDIQQEVLKLRAGLAKIADEARYLASVKATTQNVYQFSRSLAGKDPDAVLVEGFKPSPVDLDIEYRFRHGKGNLGRDFWDLLNAVTERGTHGEGNELKGDRPGDKEARRLESVLVGSLAAQNAKAFSIAIKMAKAA